MLEETSAARARSRSTRSPAWLGAAAAPVSSAAATKLIRRVRVISLSSPAAFYNERRREKLQKPRKDEPCACFAKGESAQPGVAGLMRLGDLGDQLVDQGRAEGLEVFRDHNESAGAADHVVPVVVGKAAGRVGVFGIPRRRRVAEDDQSVDGYALGHRVVARARDIATAVVGAVARNVHGAAEAFERGAIELRHDEGGALRVLVHA